MRPLPRWDGGVHTIAIVIVKMQAKVSQTFVAFKNINYPINSCEMTNVQKRIPRQHEKHNELEQSNDIREERGNNDNE